MSLTRFWAKSTVFPLKAINQQNIFTFALQTKGQMDVLNKIDKPAFKCEQQKAAINIIYTCNWLMERMKARLDAFDLTPQQFNILRILRGAQAPLSTMQIRDRMLDKMSDTSRIVDRLILKGLVQKNTCPRDKRLVDVLINATGLELLAALDVHTPELDTAVNNLSDTDIKLLNSLLDKLREGEATASEK